MPATQTRTRRPARRVITRKPNDKANGLDRAKLGMSKRIGNVLDERQLTQTEAAYLMHDAPSQISLVVSGKLRGFSAERLLRMLARLGHNIDIVVRPSKGGKHGAITFVD